MWINKGLLITIGFALMAVLYYSNVQRETLEPTKGAIDYYWSYQKLSGEAPDNEIRWPYNKRTGTPFLASLLPFDAPTSFRIVNIIAGIICVVFCYLTLQVMRVGAAVRVMCLAPLLFFEWSPLRFPFLYPYEAGPPAMAFYAIAAFFLSRKQYAGASLMLALSCSIRESGVFIGIVFAVLLWLKKERSTGQCLAILAISLSGVLISKWVSLPLWQPPEIVNAPLTTYGTLPYSGTQLEVISHFVKYRFTPPHFGIVSSLGAIMMCLAPFLIGTSQLAKWKTILLADARIAFSLGCVLVSALMATFGGQETPRIFFTSYPLFVIFLSELIRNEQALKITLMLFVGLVTHSFASVITENPYWGWIPTLMNGFAGRTLPLIVSFTVFWLLSLAICHFVNWQGVQTRLQTIFRKCGSP